MSNTVITNFTDISGPSTKTDNSVVVIVNKDGSLSVDQEQLGTLMGNDSLQSKGISVVRVGQEGKPDDATDTESDGDNMPHVTLSVDSYYYEPNSIIKYESGAEMLQSLRIETRENSLLGFQNDHCYTPINISQITENLSKYDESVIEITHAPPPKPIPSLKKNTVIEDKIIPKGRRIIANPIKSVILKGLSAISTPVSKSDSDSQGKSDADDSDSSYTAESAADRDSDVDYKEPRDRSGPLKKTKAKSKILKTQSKKSKAELNVKTRQKSNRNVLKKVVKEKIQTKTSVMTDAAQHLTKENVKATSVPISIDTPTVTFKHSLKTFRKEKKTAHTSALLSDINSLFSTPDVIRTVSTDNKTLTKEEQAAKSEDANITEGNLGKIKNVIPKTYSKLAKIPDHKVSKAFESIPQLDDASLAQILADTPASNPLKGHPSVSAATVMNPGLVGPLSPTLDLLGGLHSEEEGLTEDLLMHVAQLVESSENLQEVIDKQLSKVETTPKPTVQPTVQTTLNMYPGAVKSNKNTQPQKATIEIVRRDGRVITLPPIEAPATRSSKKKTQIESAVNESANFVSHVPQMVQVTPYSPMKPIAKLYSNKKVATKKQEVVVPVQLQQAQLQQQVETPLQPQLEEKVVVESQESWNSEDDPFRLWCICRQPHNNRFMICCDGCEDWFHGKCVNITKAMGQQMEEQGIEWRCPNCIAKAKPGSKLPKNTPGLKPVSLSEENSESQQQHSSLSTTPKSSGTTISTSCIVCRKPARASSIYCSNSCIVKHAHDSLGSPALAPKVATDTGKQNEKAVETRFIVFEPKTGKLLAGPNAPTGSNLKAWLQQHPTFEVVRSETHPVKPKLGLKKFQSPGHKVQTILNFERFPKKNPQQILKSPQLESKEIKLIPAKEMKQLTAPARSPTTPKTPVSPITKTQIMSRQATAQRLQYQDTPRPSIFNTKPSTEPKKPIRTSNRTQPEKGSPAASRRKESNDEKNVKKPESTEAIRDNVRKALQEQLTNRMSDTKGSKFTEEEIKRFANNTEAELHELFRDVGIKYKAKYRSLMFNIKDRKNQSLWQKICDKTISPKQLVRLSPEELASRELAQWRDQEAKHQLELIKKSELDLLAASKTYVLKTHKGEEVMEAKTTPTELDPNVAVEDLVFALNDDSATTEPESSLDKSSSSKSDHGKKKKNKGSDKKQDYKKSRESKRDYENGKSRRHETVEKVERFSRRSGKRARRDRSDTRSRRRSHSRDKSKRRSEAHCKSPSRSLSKGRDRSHSRSRSRRRSKSRDKSKRKGSHPKYRTSTEEKAKHHRSKSQEASNSKITESSYADVLERPKSAMLKDQSFSHPEYDPHEPMITSAFSDEDLRKSRENVYEVVELGPYDDIACNPEKFTIDTSVLSPPPNIGKFSETESDQEPSSTVDSAALCVWNGCVNMVDVARFYVAAHQVSGGATDLEDDVTAELDIVGRINPDTVWEYIHKMKKTGNKDIVVLRLQAANDEEMMQYIALYSYLNTRNRLGVVKVTNPLSVKDFYVVPLPANASPPAVLLPFEGPGIGDIKTHLLLAVIIRHRKKRPPIHIPKEMATTRSRKRSYTPPMVTPGAPPSPKRSRCAGRELINPTYTTPALSSSVKDKIAASLAMTAESEAYSPGSAGTGSAEEDQPTVALPPAAAESLRASDTLRCKMEELNRQIEEQKMQIRRMARPQANTPPPTVADQDEAYSPSRPMTPPESSIVPAPALANINLPSNLQEILATIKQRSETSDVDQRP